jgi:hypothetical protein
VGDTASWYYKTRLPELQREEEEREKMNRKNTNEIGKDEEPWEAVNIELKDKDFIRIAHEAHRRDITINRMINIILRDGMASAAAQGYPSKPQLLNES